MGSLTGILPFFVGNNIWQDLFEKCCARVSIAYHLAQQHSRATLLPSFKKIQDLLFLDRTEGEEGVVLCVVSGDPRTEKEKSMCHETFLFSLKKTNKGKNVALSKFDSSLDGVGLGLGLL